MTIAQRFNTTFEGWLTASETNAAGRMALFRILFGLFSLWMISGRLYEELGLIPGMVFRPLVIIRLIPAQPAPAFFVALELLLVASLVLLIFGFQTRVATVAVLVLGILLGAYRYSFGKISHADLFAAIYIPAMFVFASWGNCYSIDSLLRRRRGQPIVQPSDSSWRYAWPMHMTLLLLSVLFLGAALAKSTRGWWFGDTQFINDLLRFHDVREMLGGEAANPLSALIANATFLHNILRIVPLAFEALFFVSLFNKKLRTFFVSSAILFHMFNLVVLGIDFTPMLITYAIFVDWQKIYERIWPKQLNLGAVFERLPSPVLIGGVTLLAVLAALSWNSSLTLRAPFQSLPSLPFWYVATVVCSVVVVKTLIEIVSDFVSSRRTIRDWTPDVAEKHG
jgi:hypothetical protein